MEANPADPIPRRRLAALYRSVGGYDRASEFFAFTASYLEGDSLDLGRRSASASWRGGCNLPDSGKESERAEELNRTLAIARQVSKEVSQDPHGTGKGIQAAENALRENGAACFLIAEWARATLNLASSPGRAQVSVDDQELAYRLLISLGEVGISPIGYEGPASVYLITAITFAHTDVVSAYVAALLAQYHLERGSVTGFVERDTFRQRLGQRLTALGKLAAQVRAGKP